MLVEDKNANGTANTAPIKVPIKAIQIVSNNNAGTSVNSIFTSGCIIPDNTFFAISTPFDLIPLKLIPFEAHTIKSNINNTVRDLLIHVFGCFSNCFFIDISILP